MPTHSDYNHFAGKHWETGSVHNFYAYRGVHAPHRSGPYSEALLMGISGGLAMGYFSFAYSGTDPQCNILTRNTFDPLDTLLQRLGVVQTLQHTAKPQKAMDNLVNTLEDGIPAIVWADMWSLPYNALAYDANMWAMLPIVVYGHDSTAGTVWIADRANVPLCVTTAELHAARGRVKKDKFRLLTLDPPNPDKLTTAVAQGIDDTLKLFTEKPPKGSRNNFGLAAYRHWVKLLTHPKTRMSWEKEFPAGRKLFAGLTSAYHFAFLFGKGTDGTAERQLYADFLDEAAILLQKPALQPVAEHFRESGAAWRTLGQTLLPEEVEPLGEARRLMTHQHELFLQQGGASLEERQRINARLDAIRKAMETEFPLDAAGVTALRQAIAAQVEQIHDLEQTAVATLQTAMAGR